MYQTRNSYITQDLKLFDIINENPLFLLLLQHFGINFSVDNNSVEDICEKNNIGLYSFIVIGNLYNDFYPGQEDLDKIKDLNSILFFLKNSHFFYTKEKYPELKSYIKKLQEENTSNDFKLINKFFNEYFAEVIEHLKYEDEIVFPYFEKLLQNKQIKGEEFSSNKYKSHHTDIETKLTDLKNLFLKHINIKTNLNTQRKFLNELFELEVDLKIHSMIEDKILIPLIEKLEEKK